VVGPLALVGHFVHWGEKYEMICDKNGFGFGFGFLRKRRI